MALVVGNFLATFQDLGFGSALIQRRSIDDTDRSTVFWTTVTMGLVLNVVMLALAGPIAAFFHQPHIKALIEVLSVCFLISSLGMTHAALLERSMRYRAVAICSVAGTVAACIAAVSVAAAGGGAWAFIAYELAITGVVTLLLILTSGWRPQLVYSWASLKRFAKFGVNVVGSGGLGFLQTNADNILVGRYLGSAALGVYSVSYNVILIPIGRFFAPVGNTLFSAVSRIQDDRSRVSAIWIRALRGMLAVILPTIAGLIIVAPDFVDEILGKRWHSATTVIRILCLVTITFGLSAISNNMLNALGRPHIVFRLTLLNTVLAIGAFVLGLQWGIVGVAACYTAVTIPINVLGVSLINGMLGISLREFVRSLSGVAEATLFMAIVCVITRQGLMKMGVAAAPRLVLVIMVSTVVYMAATLWRNRGVIGELMEFVKPSAIVEL
jgi:O-antigen/teichoic acid export membrane protein